MSNQRLAHLSGSNVPDPSGYFRTHQGNTAMTVRFTSDASVGGQGFAASYSCQTEVEACRFIAEDVLALPECAEVQARLGEGICPVACAELWLSALTGCNDLDEAAAVEEVAAGVTTACEAMAADILATAVATVTVTVGQHPFPRSPCGAANAVYFLQPVPLNGKAHYATVDG
eukprot:SAG31_NODE_2884_length_4954_cov_2.669619_1_plen_172_part_10